MSELVLYVLQCLGAFFVLGLIAWGVFWAAMWAASKGEDAVFWWRGRQIAADQEQDRRTQVGRMLLTLRTEAASRDRRVTDLMAEVSGLRSRVDAPPGRANPPPGVYGADRGYVREGVLMTARLNGESVSVRDLVYADAGWVRDASIPRGWRPPNPSPMEQSGDDAPF